MATYTLVEDKELFDRLNRELIKIATQSEKKMRYRLIDVCDFTTEMYGCPRNNYKLLRYEGPSVVYGGKKYVYRYLALAEPGNFPFEDFRFGEDWYLFEYEPEELELQKHGS